MRKYKGFKLFKSNKEQVIRDLLEKQQEELYKLAYYDCLTGLPNRAMLCKVITEYIERARNNEFKFAMIFMDLDNFKLINDSYGHITGDALLVEVGSRLRKMNSEQIRCFRLGGDEFILLIRGMDTKEELERVSDEVHKSISSPLVAKNRMFHVTCSSGMVIYPQNGCDYEELLKNADTAMYKSKARGKATNSFYNERMGEEVIEKTEFETDLHRAIENNEFQVYYQPIFNVYGEKIRGCEALIRWMHPTLGIVSPDKFINIAEGNGTIIQIGKWVFREACTYAKKMHDKGNIDLYVSINISPYQLLQRDFVDFVLNTIEEIKVNPEMLVLEITESVFIDSMEAVIEKLTELRNHDIKIALDDFGCGYSSLNYLKKLPIDIVKIDKSFIGDIKSEEDKINISNIIILLAKQLGLTVIAEGVEEKQHLGYLRKHECDFFQGFLKSKALKEDDFILYILRA